MGLLSRGSQTRVYRGMTAAYLALDIGNVVWCGPDFLYERPPPD